MSAEGAKILPFRRPQDGYEPWLTERALAVHYGVSERTVRRWRLAGMPSRMLGGSRRFRLREVEDWHARGEAS